MEQLMELGRQVTTIDWRLWKRGSLNGSFGTSWGPQLRVGLGLMTAIIALILLTTQSMIIRQDLKKGNLSLHSMRSQTDRAGMESTRLLTELSAIKSQTALSTYALELGLTPDVLVVDMWVTSP